MFIFLDIDGVMVPAKGWKAPGLHDDGFPVFSDNAVCVLQKLLAENATIVLTSSHKGNFGIEEWKEIFKRRSINVNGLLCLPSNTKNLSRKDEILEWFSVNKLTEDFIIIDDDRSLNELPGHLKRNLVQTSPHIGLTPEHLEMANAILGRNC